jgi:hypothetical protein
MWVFYILWGAPSFIGWFLLFYTGEMLLTWVTIVPGHPEWAERLVYILMIPAISLALRKAKKAIDRQMRFR